MKERLFAVLLLMSAFALNTTAQNTATVKSFVQTTDHISGSDRLNDKNGIPCALIKVQVVDDISRVEGNRIGEVVNKGVEKWVYMCKGSRNMRIHLKNHLPVKVMFQDYKINGLESNRVYELVIEIPDDNARPNVMQTLILNYSPANATVLIDSKIFNGDGRLQLQLPIGEHSYTVAADGYISNEGTVKLNQQAPREITENLVAINVLKKSEQEKDDYEPKQQILSGTVSNSINSLPDGKIVISIENVSFSMIPVKGGVFNMGEQGLRLLNRVVLSDFYIGETEVTQELWLAVMGSNPSSSLGEKKPVENVNWNDCQEFTKRLSQMTGRNFRLPTEAEWEYSARGGKMSKGYKYAGSNEIKTVAWYNTSKTHDVGQKSPNELGIYDMTGNVFEWCQDWYCDYVGGTKENPTGPSTGSKRVIRGGAYLSPSRESGLLKRYKSSPKYHSKSLGLRLVQY